MQMIEVDEVYNLVRDRLAAKPRLELTIMPPALANAEARV